MATTAVAYIRRSHRGEAAISTATQRREIAQLADKLGLALVGEYKDLGRSGRLSDDVDADTLEAILRHRPEAWQLMQAIQAGHVGAVLAYRQDRYARNSFTLQFMLRVARRHAVPLFTPRGDITADENRLLAAVEGGMDEEEGDRAHQRGTAAQRTKNERGDTPGVAPYGWMPDPAFVKGGSEPYRFVRNPAEDVEHVLAVYREHGTYLGTVRALNAAGFPSKRGRTWQTATIRGIVQREAPELAAGVTKGRRQHHRPRLFAGLLRCWCGGLMSPGSSTADLWYCSRGQRGAHAKPFSITEAKLLPWLQQEAGRLRTRAEVLVATGAAYDDTEDRLLVAQLRSRGRGAQADALEAELDAERVAAGEQVLAMQQVPQAIEWDTDPVPEVNAVLRAMWSHVQLGPDLLPTEAVWQVPEWRRP